MDDLDLVFIFVVTLTFIWRVWAAILETLSVTGNLNQIHFGSVVIT